MVLCRICSRVDKILWKKSINFTSFSKEIFSIYFEHNRNLIEVFFSSLEHSPKSDEIASALLELRFHYVSKVPKKLASLSHLILSGCHALVQEFIEIEAWLLLTFFTCFIHLINFYAFFCNILRSTDVWKLWFIK